MRREGVALSCESLTKEFYSMPPSPVSISKDPSSASSASPSSSIASLHTHVHISRSAQNQKNRMTMRWRGPFDDRNKSPELKTLNPKKKHGTNTIRLGCG